MLGWPRLYSLLGQVSWKLFFGGFSHKSLLRIKCFDVFRSNSWAVFFLLVTIANSIFISILPELIEEEVNSFGIGPPKSVGTPTAHAVGQKPLL